MLAISSESNRGSTPSCFLRKCLKWDLRTKNNPCVAGLLALSYLCNRKCLCAILHSIALLHVFDIHKIRAVVVQQSQESPVCRDLISREERVKHHLPSLQSSPMLDTVTLPATHCFAQTFRKWFESWKDKNSLFCKLKNQQMHRHGLDISTEVLYSLHPSHIHPPTS